MGGPGVGAPRGDRKTAGKGGLGSGGRGVCADSKMGGLGIQGCGKRGDAGSRSWGWGGGAAGSGAQDGGRGGMGGAGPSGCRNPGPRGVLPWPPAPRPGSGEKPARGCAAPAPLPHRRRLPRARSSLEVEGLAARPFGAADSGFAAPSVGSRSRSRGESVGPGVPARPRSRPDPGEPSHPEKPGQRGSLGNPGAREEENEPPRGRTRGAEPEGPGEEARRGETRRTQAQTRRWKGGGSRSLTGGLATLPSSPRWGSSLPC